MIWLIITGSIVVLTIALFTYTTRTGTIIVFCNVGQGDGIYMRLSNRTDIIIDAGPDDSMLICLGKHMPFYDKTIEAAFLSHPHADHYNGFLTIVDRYHLEVFFASPYKFGSERYKRLIAKLMKNNIPVKPLYQGDEIAVTGAFLRTLWPQKSFIEALDSKDDVNSMSQVLDFRTRNTSILFTGDINPVVLDRLLQQSISNYHILKVPHHGSTEGLTQKFLKLADPTYSVISSGSGNKYGHPHKKILQMLTQTGTRIRRTDMEGDVVFRF